MEESDKLQATLTGLAVGAAAHVIRQNQDTNDRLDRSRDDIDAVNRRLRDLLNNGHIIRDMMPVVADFLSGIALSRTQNSTPTLLPNLQTIGRPELVSMLSHAVTEFKWPPVEGTYTNEGFIQSAGELTSIGLALTYEEVRAILTGLVLEKAPSFNQKGQAYSASNGLIQAIIAQNYSAAQWIQIWKDLLGGGVQQLPQPLLTSLGGPWVASLLPGARNGAMNVKLVVNGALNAGTPVAKIKFGTMGNVASFTNTPAIVVGGPWQIDSPNNVDCILTPRIGFVNGDTATVAVIVEACDGA